MSLSQPIHFLPFPFQFDVGVSERAAVWCLGAYNVNPWHREIFVLVISYFGIHLDDTHRSYLFSTSSDY